mmetsp:Transcript_15614/g.46061  ORF Transcript_15614/g.46061 Transcript_15614/m.46061 type:complete len:458 (-) Transcript_15614:390-1763(-)
MEHDEPDHEEDDDEEDHKLQQYDDAYVRQYENEHTWEQLREDEHGNLQLDLLAEQRAKRRRLLTAAQSARIRKGMIRYVVLVIDLSRASSAQDMRPNRLSVMLRVAKAFVRNFFDQNPLSQLGIVLMREGLAERLTDLSGSPESQIKCLSSASLTAGGNASLQNALELTAGMLAAVPPYGNREALFLFASLSTCDPGNVFTAVKACTDARVRVSVVGVAAEVYVCRRMADDTGGRYAIALGEAHLEELLLAHSSPPPATAGRAGVQLVQMGFPQRSTEDQAGAVHVGADVRLMAAGYTCPRCKARAGELPSSCHVCGLTLIASPHLARSYHHLFPVPPFDEVPSAAIAKMVQEEGGSGSRSGLSNGGSGGGLLLRLECYGCLRSLDAAADAALWAEEDGRGGDAKAHTAGGKARAAPPMVLRCANCRQVFCFDCDTYVHESLHNCPGCEVLGTARAS